MSRWVSLSGLDRLTILLTATAAFFVIMGMSQVFSDDDWVRHLERSPARERPHLGTTLRDLGHVRLPDLSWVTIYRQTLTLVPLWTLMVMLVVVSARQNRHDPTRLVRRFAALQTVLFALRAITLLGTRMPPADQSCVPAISIHHPIHSALRMIAHADLACTGRRLGSQPDDRF